MRIPSAATPPPRVVRFGGLLVLIVTHLMSIGIPTSAAAQGAPRTSVYLTFGDALPTLQTLADDLPADLKSLDESQAPAQWLQWVKKYDQDVRKRLAQGDEDSLVNLLFFGTTFTKEPRATQAQINEIRKRADDTAAAQRHINEIIQVRLDDFVRALSQPSKEERITFAQEFLSSRYGLRLSTPEGQSGAKKVLLGALARVLKEVDDYTEVIQQARLLGDDTALFVERSQLYRNRGLSSDTSLRPNHAIEETLKELQAKGLLKPGSIRRVAIVGPGLDFADKQSGYDFYPQQTIQPFAVIDSLLRFDLAKAAEIEVSTLDLSPKINDHIQRARTRGAKGEAYTIQLPFDTQEQWKPAFVQYWERFGDKIGSVTTPAPVPANAGTLKVRAVSVQPAFAAKITPYDTNIVLQHLEMPEGEKFDLIIGTNIFLYYDGFYQSLALANVAKMLRVGGFLLSNHALLEIPSSTVNWTGVTKVRYSDAAAVDGDFVIWYRRNK